MELGGYRVPEFDLEVAAQNETPYKTMEYNQLALQLFQMGFFRADMAEQALRCLDLMEFKNKDQLAAVIRQGRQRTQQAGDGRRRERQRAECQRSADAGCRRRCAGHHGADAAALP